MSISLTSEQIVIDRIKVDPNRTPDEGIVVRLMESIAAVGVLQPIVLCRPGTGLGVNLVFGRNRLEACRRLKMKAVLARVVNGNSTEIRDWCARATRDENGVRRPMLQIAAVAA